MTNTDTAKSLSDILCCPNVLVTNVTFDHTRGCFRIHLSDLTEIEVGAREDIAHDCLPSFTHVKRARVNL